MRRLGCIVGLLLAVLGAAALVLVHNHPSGDPTPSPEDREITARLDHAASCDTMSGPRLSNERRPPVISNMSASCLSQDMPCCLLPLGP